MSRRIGIWQFLIRSKLKQIHCLRQIHLYINRFWLDLILHLRFLKNKRIRYCIRFSRALSVLYISRGNRPRATLFPSVPGHCVRSSPHVFQKWVSWLESVFRILCQNMSTEKSEMGPSRLGSAETCERDVWLFSIMLYNSVWFCKTPKMSYDL